ncbi:MAG: 2-amino-4-hydroxy-6-hydroxymethyldihydropteridine diphosphokinase [Acidobacteriota bacterium]
MAIFLGLGSNIGDRLANLNEAFANFSVLQKSSIYETEPVALLDQPWFLNAVIHIDTQLSPHGLLEFCQNLEKRMGRKRDIPKGPRTIDIDLLFYENLTVTDPPRLIIPHPEIAQRRFVLEPLNEIAAHFVHPVLKRRIAELLRDCEDDSVVGKL